VGQTTTRNAPANVESHAPERARERERRERKRVELGLYKPSTVAAALPPKRQITEWRTSNPAVAADENKKHDYPAGMNGGFLKRA